MNSCPISYLYIVTKNVITKNVITKNVITKNVITKNVNNCFIIVRTM